MILLVVSVFINPKQFDDPNDFDAYPADYPRMISTGLRNAGVDAVLLPDARANLCG